jgi:cytochrome P450
MSDPATVCGYAEAFETLCDRRLVQSMYNECDELMERVLLTLHGEQHTRRRAIELKLFRRDFTRYYEREVYPGVLEHSIAPYLERGRMDLPEFGFRVNINLSARIAGIDRDLASVTEDETQLLIKVVRKFSEGATLFHSTRDKDEVRREVAEALAVFEERFLRPSWERREQVLAAIASGRAAPEEAPRDILTVLLQYQAEQDLDDAMIRREVAFFMQAATHSSANAVVHAFHEITQWCATHPEDRVRIAEDPVFLQRCVHESLRLHPASPVAWRVADCPFQLASGDTVAAGDSVLIDLQHSNQDKARFGEDAQHFNPHRSVSDRTPPYALTFGVGVHTCFGRDLAGGALPTEDTDPATHHYGTLTSLLRSLFAHDARPDPDNPPQRDAGTERANWARYPILLNREAQV